KPRAPGGPGTINPGSTCPPRGATRSRQTAGAKPLSADRPEPYFDSARLAPLSESRQPESSRKTALALGVHPRHNDSFPGQPCAFAGMTSDGSGRALTEIYIDGDACPVREEVYRVATRLGLMVFVVSNGSRPLRPPNLPNVRMILVGDMSDAADDWIAERIGASDVCVTSDVPLASRCLANGAHVVAPNGREWTEANIAGALAGRELSRHLRELGMQTRGPAALTKADRSRFLSTLDTAVHKALHET